jgi:hypothetical protein
MIEVAVLILTLLVGGAERRDTTAAHSAQPPPPPALSPPPLDVMEVWGTPFVSTMISEPATLAQLITLVKALRRADPGVEKSNKEAGGWHSQELLQHGFIAEMLGSRAGGSATAEEAASSIEALGEVVKLIERAAARMVGGTNSGKSETTFVQNVWALANRRGEYNVPHSHPHAVLSGVLHLDTGDSDAGKIVFHDPRPILTCSGAVPELKRKLFFLCTWCHDPVCPSEPGDVGWNSTHHQLDASQRIVQPPTPGRLQLWPAWVPHEVLPHAGDSDRLSLAFNVWITAKETKRESTLPLADAVQQTKRVAAFMRGAAAAAAAGASRGGRLSTAAHTPFNTQVHWVTPLAEVKLPKPATGQTAYRLVSEWGTVGKTDWFDKRLVLHSLPTMSDVSGDCAADVGSPATINVARHGATKDHGGGGDCFFRSLAAQLAVLDADAEQHLAARQHTVNRMKADQNLLSIAVSSLLPLTLRTAAGDRMVHTTDEYIEWMGRGGTYIEGEAEIKAAADAYNVPISVWNYNGKLIVTHQPHHSEAPDEGVGGETAYFEWQQQTEHYVQRIPAPTPSDPSHCEGGEGARAGATGSAATAGWNGNEWIRVWLRNAAAEFLRKTNRAPDPTTDGPLPLSTTPMPTLVEGSGTNDAVDNSTVILWASELTIDKSNYNILRPFPHHPRNTARKPQIAGLFVVDLLPTGEVNYQRTAHLVRIDLPDPRPETRDSIKIDGSGEVLRWGGRSGEGVLFPAWLAQTAQVKVLVPPSPLAAGGGKVAVICFWAVREEG